MGLGAVDSGGIPIVAEASKLVLGRAPRRFQAERTLVHEH